MKREALHPDETILIERRARATGTLVQLVYNFGADPEQPWETICVDHGGVCSHETRPLATSWLAHPDEWCEDCTHGEGTLAGKPIAEPKPKTETIQVYRWDQPTIDVEVEFREIAHWLTDPVADNGRKLKRYEVLVGGKVVGKVESFEHHSHTTYAGSRIRRDLGTPVRWTWDAPNQSGHFLPRETRKSATSDLLAAVLR